MADAGIWRGEIINNGLRSLVIDVEDITTGIPTEIFHQRIRFAAYDAYPSGTVWTNDVLMDPNSVYQITATPNGPRGSSATVIDHLIVAKPPIASFTYSVLDATVTVDASGSSDPDGTIVSYLWDWGDGTTGSGVIASHTYTATKTYTITLTVTDDMGLTNSVSESVYVQLPKMPPVASFTYTTDQLTVSVDATGSYDPDGTIVSYDWSWGDGTTGTGMTATHTYGMDGTYEVVLTVTDNDGMTDDASAMVSVAKVNMKPIAAFTYLVSDMTVSVDASGSSDPDGFITTYDWDWGDGATDSGMTATHTYASYGTYLISLTVTDDQGATGTASQSVKLNAPPVASFTATVDKMTVSVDASGSTDDGMIVSYAWDWGDGTTGTGMSATHKYSAYGTYTITLTVTDDGGKTDSTSKSVDIVNTPPIASFTATVSVLTVSVDASGSTDDGTIVSYAWDWGDGATGAGKTASHTYSSYGAYTITLTVTDDGGLTGSTSKLVDLANMPPIASFTATVDKMTVSVDASGSSDPDGVIVSYDWNWGDGTTGTGMTATHTYSTYGTKTITLTVTDNGGASASKSMDVQIVNMPPVASFTTSITLRTVSVDASASGDPDGTIVSYAWNWGDGTTGTGMTATHTYALGTFTITLTVTDNGGATATATRSVTIVNAPPTASFTASVTLRTASVDASASSDPDGTIATYAWNWGDGSTGSGKTASHTYTLAGTYTITLTITDNDGATATATKSVTIVNQLPTASFTATVTMRTVSVDASASSDPDGTIASYSWNWGDGTPAGSGKTATHTYATVGTKTITLTVTDNEGGTGSTSKDVTIVNTPPTASFTVSVTLRTASVDASASSDPDG
ncbi:MAG: PKD domain-containing protein, partial [Thermoplasmata archaeon]